MNAFHWLECNVFVFIDGSKQFQYNPTVFLDLKKIQDKIVVGHICSF